MLALWDRDPAPMVATLSEREAVTKLQSFDRDALLVAVADEVVVGAMVATWDGWRGNIYRLVVEPAWRRRGVARALIDAAEERLRGLGAMRVAVLVHHPNEVAAALWRSSGYRWMEGVDRYVRDV